MESSRLVALASPCIDGCVRTSIAWSTCLLTTSVGAPASAVAVTKATATNAARSCFTRAIHSPPFTVPSRLTYLRVSSMVQGSGRVSPTVQALGRSDRPGSLDASGAAWLHPTRVYEGLRTGGWRRVAVDRSTRRRRFGHHFSPGCHVGGKNCQFNASSAATSLPLPEAFRESKVDVALTGGRERADQPCRMNRVLTAFVRAWSVMGAASRPVRRRAQHRISDSTKMLIMRTP